MKQSWDTDEITVPSKLNLDHEKVKLARAWYRKFLDGRPSSLDDRTIVDLYDQLHKK